MTYITLAADPPAAVTLTYFLYRPQRNSPNGRLQIVADHLLRQFDENSWKKNARGEFNDDDDESTMMIMMMIRSSFQTLEGGWLTFLEKAAKPVICLAQRFNAVLLHDSLPDRDCTDC